MLDVQTGNFVSRILVLMLAFYFAKQIPNKSLRFITYVYIVMS